MHSDFLQFKKYASFILEHHIDSIAVDLLEKARESNLSVLKHLAHLTNDQLIELSKEGLVTQVISPVLEGRPYHYVIERIQVWKSDNLLVPKEKLNILDVANIHNLRKSCLVTYLRYYECSREELIALFEEINIFFSTCINIGLQAYEEIQRGELLEKNKVLNGLLSNLPVIVSRITREGKIVEVTGSGLSKLGLKENEVQGINMLELSPEYPDHIRNVYLGKSVSYVGKWNHGVKSYYFENYFFQEDEKSGTILGFSLDITEREESQEKLNQIQKAAEQRETLHNLFMQVPALIGVLIGKEGRVELFNPAFTKLWGNRQVIGKTMREAWPDLEGKEYFELIEDVYTTGKPLIRTEYPGWIDRHNKGQLEIGYFNYVYQPYYNVQGKIDGVLLFGVEVTEEVKAKQKIQESEERFRTIADEAPAFIFLAGQNADVEFLNKTWLEFTGMTFEESSGEGSLDATHPDDIKLVMDTYNESYSQQKPYSFEIRQRAANGEYRWIFWKGIPRYLNNGQFVGMMGIGIDIHDRKLVEEEKQELISIIEASSDFVGLASLDEKVKYVNPAGLRMVGWDNWEGKRIIDSFYPEDRELVIQLLKGLTKGGNFSQEIRVCNEKTGKATWIIWNGLTIKDSGTGKITAYATISPDITDRKQAEFALKESEERFRSLADQSPMIVYIIEANEQGSISYFNKTWLDYTGQTFEEAIGRAWDGIVHPDDVKEVMEIYLPAFEKRQSYTLPAIRLRRHDGQYRWHLFKCNPRHLSNGEFIGFVGVAIDIHEERIMFEQLELNNVQLKRINNDLDNFIYTASHDLKAPITNIEGLIFSLKEEFQSGSKMLDPDTEMLFTLMEKSIERFKDTILDLTEIAKIQKAQEEDVEEINFNELLDDIKLSIHDKIVESGVEIQADFTKVGAIKFSKKNLKSVLYNLVSNAIKYRDSRRPPKILIKTIPTSGYTILYIQDNGLGIKKQHMDKLFTMFKRFHDHVEGTGIGLYIVKRIIDNSEGKIEVESQEGVGTTFKVYFKS